MALAVACGFALLVWGQYEVSQHPSHVPFHWPLLRGFNHWLERDVFHTRTALAFALPLFVVGGAIIAVLAPIPYAEQAERWRSKITLTRRRAIAISLMLVPPLLIWSYLLFRLANHHYKPEYRWWMAVAVFWVLITLTVIDRAGGRLPLPRLRRSHALEALLVLALAGTFIGINARDLAIWRYSAIGDEGTFWDFTRRVARGDPLNWFAQAGPYGYHPILSSVWQALVMRFFGTGLFGWKMASVLGIVLTFPMFYWLLRQLFGARVAAFGTLFLTASHYLFSYAHTGYDNMFTLFPTTAALAFFVAGLRRASYTLLFIAGFFAGLGWYTFYPSRSAIVMLAVAVLLMGRRGVRPEIIAPIAAGFLMSVMPMFATNKYDVIRQMLIQSRSQSHQPFFDKITQNTPRTFLAFSFNPSNIHYVAGALMDSISFTLAVAGIAVCLRGIRHQNYRLVVIWLLVGAVVSGLLSAYDFVSISRLSFLMPPMAAFAGIGIDRLIASAAWPVRRPSFERVMAAASFAALAPLLFIINGQHFFGYSARHNPTTPETVVVREFTSAACKDQPLRDIVYGPNPDSLIIGLWRFFGMMDRMPIQFDFKDVPRAYNSYPAAGGVGCTAIINSDDKKITDVTKRIQLGASGDRSDFRYASDLSHGSNVAFVPATRDPRGLDADAIAKVWRTDLTRGTGLAGVVQGQEKDAIAPVDRPDFTAISNTKLGELEPVVVLQDEAGYKAYPVRVLIWRGVVNDTLRGEPIAVTYDPISASVRVVKRTVAGRVLSFGTSGLLRGGNALLYDRETESWWQQMTGTAITGAMTGTTLETVPATVTAWSSFRNTFPDSEVLTLDDPDQYFRNPYLGYDTPNGKPIFTRAGVDDRLPAMHRVAVLDIGGKQVAVAYPDAATKKNRVLTVDVGGRPIVLFFQWGAGSGLDVRVIRDSRPVGAFAAYSAEIGGETRSFYLTGEQADINKDQETQTRWDYYGRGIEGEDKDHQLTPVNTVQGFWFAVAAAYPGIELVQP